MRDWALLRKTHLETTDVVYLNSPANGIISADNIANEYAETKKYLANPGLYRMQFMAETIPAIKKQVASSINASDTQIALIQNFSVGINFFVSSLPKNTKILLFRNDYPSLLMPFELREFDICWIDFEEDLSIDLAKLELIVKREKPDIIAISHCQWLTGYVADLEGIGSICKQNNCLFLVDATQSFGATDIDVKKCNISVLGASCYKWALAGFGNGFMYISEETLQIFPPKMGGFGSYLWDKGAPYYVPSIKSYEPGHLDHAAFHRLHFALTQIAAIGIDSIHTKITELMHILMAQLEQKNIDPIGKQWDNNRLAIVSIPSKPNLFKHLINSNIEVSERGGNIRLGVHYYNNLADIETFISVMESFTPSS